MPEDTRDRLIALEVEVRHLVKMVERNSSLLDDLHELHQQAKGGLTVGKFLLGSAKSLGSGGVGAAVLWAAQHFGKLAA